MKVRKNYAQTTSKASTDHQEFYQRKISATGLFDMLNHFRAPNVSRLNVTDLRPPFL